MTARLRSFIAFLRNAKSVAIVKTFKSVGVIAAKKYRILSQRRFLPVSGALVTLHPLDDGYGRVSPAELRLLKQSAIVLVTSYTRSVTRTACITCMPFGYRRPPIAAPPQQYLQAVAGVIRGNRAVLSSTSALSFATLS